jgi:hypothetical protein
MSIHARLDESAGSENLVRFETLLALPDRPWSVIWCRRTEIDSACAWLR